MVWSSCFPVTIANPYIDPGIDFSGDPGRTDQSQASDADVNIIMKRYLQTGVLPSVSGTPLYDDFSDTVDYHEAMNIVIRAQQQFDGLDAFVRAPSRGPTTIYNVERSNPTLR